MASMSGVGLASRTRARSRRAATLAVPVLALALAGLALAACGGEEELSRGEYERELQETAREIDTAFARVDSELRNVGEGSASLDKAADTVDSLRDRLEEQLERLRNVDPPGEADAPHDKLVEGLDELAAELGAFREAVDNGDVQRLQDFAARDGDLDGMRKIESATRELESQGYDVRG